MHCHRWWQVQQTRGNVARDVIASYNRHLIIFSNDELRFVVAVSFTAKNGIHSARATLTDFPFGQSRRGPEPELIYITSTTRRAASSANFQRDHQCPETAHFFINQSYWTFPCRRMNHLFGDGLRTHNGTNLSQTNRRVCLSVNLWYSFSTCSFLRSAPASLCFLSVFNFKANWAEDPRKIHQNEAHSKCSIRF